MNMIWIMIGIGLLAGLCFLLSSCIKQSLRKKDMTRSDYPAMLEKIEKTFQERKENKKIRLTYAQRLFEVGEFAKVQEILQPLLTSTSPPAKAMYLAAHIDYLHGRYASAEKRFSSLLSKSPSATSINAQIGLVGVYYQTNQYAKAQTLFKGMEGKIHLPLWTMMKGFGNEPPYRIDWQGNDRSIIPFIMTDPLPVIAVEINGRKINVFIDTGAELFYLDEAVARSLGITSIVRDIESGYAGGKSAEVGYGRADSLTIGDVTIGSIPIKTGPIQRFSGFFKDNISISGILSTGVLQQFLATIDYPQGRLILRLRGEESLKALKAEYPQSVLTEIPFVLGLTHILVCKSAIHAKKTLHLFLDCGLICETASLLLPKQTLEYVGIPVPKTETIPQSAGGLGGGGFPVGKFTVDKVEMGALRQDGVSGLYGVFPPSLYFCCEFIVDGIISHQFLKKYQWTIDFDAMKMVFGQ